MDQSVSQSINQITPKCSQYKHSSREVSRTAKLKLALKAALDNVPINTVHLETLQLQKQKCKEKQHNKKQTSVEMIQHYVTYRNQ